MATAKQFLSLLLVVSAMAAQYQVALSENCSAGLGNLMTCAPYVVPGINSGPPSAQCCTALQGVDHSCLCNTINIISQLPGRCKLPAVDCSA